VKIVIRRRGDHGGDPWPWKVYCQHCNEIRRRYEVAAAHTFGAVLREACYHARTYHEVVL
jgi:hypothetical protein